MNLEKDSKIVGKALIFDASGNLQETMRVDTDIADASTYSGFNITTNITPLKVLLKLCTKWGAAFADGHRSCRSVALRGGRLLGCGVGSQWRSMRKLGRL